MDLIIVMLMIHSILICVKWRGNMGGCLENDSKERADILKLKERILLAEKERINGKGMTIEEVRGKLNKENNV